MRSLHGRVAQRAFTDTMTRMPSQAVRIAKRKFFISFNSADRDKAHWIAWTLKDARHEVAVYMTGKFRLAATRRYG